MGSIVGENRNIIRKVSLTFLSRHISDISFNKICMYMYMYDLTAIAFLTFERRKLYHRQPDISVEV